MSRPLPDKWIRKAISDALAGLTVSSKQIPVFDTNAPNYTGSHYIIMSSQTTVETRDKCGNGWRSTILVEAVTRHKKNHGSRVLIDDIAQAVLSGIDDIQLDPVSNLRIESKTLSLPNDITQKTLGEVINRKFIRYEFLIN